MKKIGFVFSGIFVLAFALVAHLCMSSHVSMSTVGDNFRGGECYMIKTIEQCNGSYGCEFHACTAPTFCPFRKLNEKIREFYYTEVKEATEYGRTSYKKITVRCIKEQTCSTPCSLRPDKAGYYCTEDSHVDGPEYNAIEMDGEICDPHSQDN